MVRGSLVFVVVLACSCGDSDELPENFGDAGAGDAVGEGDSDAAGSGAEGPDKFSFFVTSLASLRKLSNSQSGFGGDLRYGETGEGAGLRGADKICAEIAELSMPGASAKQWRAFLSTSKVIQALDGLLDRFGVNRWSSD